MDQRGSSPSETFGRWKSQRRLHRKTTKAIGNLGSSQSSRAESVCGPAAEGEGEMSHLVWMREEDDQLRGAAVSGERTTAISKRLCPSETAILHRAREIRVELA